MEHLFDRFFALIMIILNKSKGREIFCHEEAVKAQAGSSYH